MKTSKKLKLLTLMLALIITIVSVPASAHTLSSISAGTETCAVVDSSANLWTWGYNFRNNLGYATNGNIGETPQIAMNDVSSVVSGSGVLYVIKNDNSLWKIGGNTEGLADPVYMTDNVKQVAIANGIPMILKNDGTLIAKGTDYSGLLGSFNPNGKDYPEYITVMRDIVFVSGGNEDVAVIKNDGSLWYWGTYGNINNKKYISQTKLLDDVIDVSLNYTRGNNAVVKADGSLWEWSGKEMPKKIDEDVIDACDGANAYIKKDNSLWVKDVELRYRNSSGSVVKMNDKTTVTKVLDNVANVSPGTYFASYDSTDFYLISLTDGTVKIVFADLIENKHGFLGNGTKSAPDGIDFHTPLYVSAKVLEANKISETGYIECPFSDVSVSDYFYKAVVWAVENGVTQGSGKNTFSPSSNCTRGQVVTFLYRATQNAYGDKEVIFDDVNENDYFYDAVKWAVSSDITTGTSKAAFSPNEFCTYAQIITFIWRANGSEKVSVKGTIAEAYDDDAYYKMAVAWADSKGILDGMHEEFSPNDLAKRCDVVTYIYRVSEN